MFCDQYSYIILLLVIFSTSNVKGGRYEVVGSDLTCREVQNKCKAFGAAWDLPDYQAAAARTALQQLLTNSSASSVCLAYAKTVYSQWTWSSGVTGGIEKNWDSANKNKSCAGLSINKKDFTDMDCMQRNNGFVCQLQSGISCPPYLGYLCFKDEQQQQTYLMGCNASSWFDAVSYCNEQGGSLAELDTPASKAAVLKYFKSNCKQFYEGHCDTLFLGLEKEKWTKSGDKIPRETFWLSSQDYNRAGHCVFLVKTKGVYKWLTMSCDTKSIGICQNYKYEEEPAIPPIPENLSTPSAQYGVAVGVPVVICLGIIVVLIIIICLLYRKMRKQPKMSDPEEQVPLTERVAHAPGPDPVNVETVLLPATKKIIMFSSHIDTNNEKLKKMGAHITNITWSGNNTDRMDGTETAIEMCETIQKMDNLSPDILNINALNQNGTLNEDYLENIIEFLIANAKDTAVVYLPKLTVEGIKNLEKQERIIQKLQKLKDRVVVVTMAQRQALLPAIESIAVSHISMSSTCNKVVDLLVVIRKKVVDNYGPAVISGICAIIVEELSFKLNDTNVTRTVRKLLINLSEGRRKYASAHEGFGRIDLESINLSKEQICQCYDKLCKENQLLCRNPSLESASSLVKRPEVKISVAFIIYNASNKKQNSLGWNIKTFQGTSEKNNSSELVPEPIHTFIEELENFVGGSLAEKTLKEMVEIRVFPLDSKNSWTEVSSRLEETVVCNYWEGLSHTLDELLKDKPNVVFMQNIPGVIPSSKGLGIVSKTSALRDGCVILTNALPADGTNTVPQYPANLAIAVGRENEEANRDNNVTYYRGSSIDLVAPNPENDTELYPAVYTTAYIIAALIKANSDLGVDQDGLRDSSNTFVVQKFLRNKCSNCEDYNIYEGWGLLEKRTLLNCEDPGQFNMKPHAEQSSYWNGKNI